MNEGEVGLIETGYLKQIDRLTIFVFQHEMMTSGEKTLTLCGAVSLFILML